MNDLISRQAAIDAINCDITVTGRQNAELVAATIGTFVDRIKALPSAQPEPLVKESRTLVKDTISRQALCEYALNQKDKSVTPNDIMRFPSAR